jgi:hypothetical protein
MSSTINEWMEKAERLERELAEAKAQVAALRDVVTLMDKYFKNRGLGYPYPSSIMPQISKVLADTATASRRHDNEVAARALEDAARWFDDGIWQTRKAFAWQSNTVCNELRRLAAEKRREQ